MVSKSKHEKNKNYDVSHDLRDQLAKGKKIRFKSVTRDFEKQLKYFKDNGWKFIKMSELKNHENENKVVAIT